MRKVSKRQVLLAAVLIIAVVAIIAASQFGSAGAAPSGDSISLAMNELTKQGVPVEAWRLDGTSLSVSLASKSTTEVGTPDDPINVSLVEREAFLAKSRGVELSELKLDVTNANGKSLFVGIIVLDKTLDPAWASGKALSETETLAALQSGLAAKTDLAGLTVKQFDLAAAADARELVIAATSRDVKTANQSTAAFMSGLYVLLENLNAGKQAQIALARVQITDESGQPLLNWIYDGQRHAQNWWQAEGMTTEWFESPGPASATPAVE